MYIADTFLTRLVGLLGRSALAEEEGLLIQPSSGIHTWGMRFPIDIVALDHTYRVTRLCEHLKPYRIGGMSLHTRAVLELPAGRIARAGIAEGDQLSIDFSLDEA